MTHFDSRPELPPSAEMEIVPEADVSHLRLPNRIRLVQKAACLLIPAMLEYLGKVNEWSEIKEPQWEPKWTHFDLQNQLLLLQERKWPLTTREFSDAVSDSRAAENRTLDEPHGPPADLRRRIISVRDAVIDCFSDLLKDDRPLSDCFHGDGVAFEEKYIYALFGKLMKDLGNAYNEGIQSNVTDQLPKSPIDTAAATASIEHTLYQRWGRILWDSTPNLSAMRIPVYGPPSALSQLNDIVQQLIHGGDDS
jgi:hypothetical protein